MPFAIRGEIEGLPHVIEQLRQLPKKLAKKALRTVVGAAGTILLRNAKARCPRHLGILRKSLGKKIKVYSSGVGVSIVGARKGFRQQIGVRVKDSGPGARYPKKAGDPIYADPAKYLHLVELGTARNTATHFLTEARNASKAAILKQAQDIVDKALKESV